MVFSWCRHELGLIRPRTRTRSWGRGLIVGLWLALLCVAVVPVAADSGEGQVFGVKSATHPEWFKDSFLDITEDAEEAGMAGKHLILMMEMEGCPYCYKMMDENFANAPYRDFIQEHFDVVAINVRGSLEVQMTPGLSMTEREVAEHFGVRFTPTVVFVNADNEAVAGVQGYRNVEDFRLVLEYVQEQAYRIMSLNEYVAARRTEQFYVFRDHPQFIESDDLSALVDKPLAVLFEDEGCVACDALHDGHLANPEIQSILEGLTVVRLDARSDEPLLDPQGNPTTPREWAESLGIEYRPSVVLFDRGEEVLRIDAMLYSFHFGALLEYVAGRHFRQYPGDPWAFVNAKMAELTSMGEDVHIVDE
jgi:thioredoxin-related protein